MHLRDIPSIPQGALVLEIGGGGDPSPQASILLDRYPDADGVRQRGGVDLVRDSRQLIHGDGLHLPFRDGQFDYVIASHVLEHVRDPARFVSEMQRVASRGYIETPSLIYERMRAIPEHLWFVHLADGVVYVAPRGLSDAWASLTDRLFDLPPFCKAIDALPEVFFLGMEWQQSLQTVLCESLEELIDRVPADWMQSAVAASEARQRRRRPQKPPMRRFAHAVLPPIVAAAINRASRTIFHGRRDRPTSPPEVFRAASWRELVVCPQCLGDLIERREDALDCARCAIRFEIHAGDVPCLLVDEREDVSRLQARSER